MAEINSIAKVTFRVSSKDLFSEKLDISNSLETPVIDLVYYGIALLNNLGVQNFFSQTNGGLGSKKIGYGLLIAGETELDARVNSGSGTQVANISIPAGEFAWIPIYNDSEGGTGGLQINTVSQQQDFWYYFATVK